MNAKNGNGRPAKPPTVREATRTPGGVIRKGQRKPYKKATQMLVEQRIEELTAFYQRHPLASRFDVYKRFCKKWGLRWNTVDMLYIVRARQRIAQMARFSKESARETALGVVMRMLDHRSPRVRLRAVKVFTEITGCVAPLRTEVSGPDGGPIRAEGARPLADLSDAELRRLADKSLGR